MNYLLETKSHLHPRQPHTWLGHRRGRAGAIDYLKTINDFYINRIMIDSIPPIDSNNVNTISQIANLCPDIHGEAVYNARTLLAAMGIEEQYDDDMICNAGLRAAKTDDPLSNIVEEANAYLKSQENNVIYESSNNILLYPNPISNELHIFSNNLINSEKLVIYNYLGEAVLSNKLSNSDGQLIIDVSKLENGIYLLHLLNNVGTILQNSKFIISK